MVLALTARCGVAGDIVDLSDAGRARLATLEEVTAGAAVLLGALQSLVGLDGSTLPQVLTLAPLGHAPGMYAITPHIRVRTVAAAGQVTLTLNWTDPQSGAASFVLGAFLLTSTTFAPLNVRSILSSGATAITMTATLTAAIVGGPPVFDLAGAATRAAA